jgi:hypothetical protein
LDGVTSLLSFAFLLSRVGSAYLNIQWLRQKYGNSCQKSSFHTLANQEGMPKRQTHEDLFLASAMGNKSET